MPETDVPPEAAFYQLVNGAHVTQIVYIAAKLRIADLLADGPCTAEELAAATGAHSGALYRVLRTLASLGIFSEIAPRCFDLTPLAELLRDDHPASMRAFTIFRGEEDYRAWADTLHSVMTGAPAFEHVYGMSHFAYLAAHPEAGATFNRTMIEGSRQATAAVVVAYDFSVARTLVDVGGGQGALITAILRAYPALRGILFDQPHMVAGARSALEGAGVADRCECAGGDFFASVPSGADLYVLRRILHDWDDERAVTILRSCVQAMTPSGKVLVVEHVLGSGSEPSRALFLDLQMLVLERGRERTEAEFHALFTAAGLALTRIVPLSTGQSIVEGVRLAE
jgi:predicted O-methyltransferase YrrM